MTEIVFVVKASKFCNLRCLYCYEHRELHVRDRICDGTLARLFADVDVFGERLREVGIAPRFSFVWHGGEPLLLPPGFYRQVIDLENRHINKFQYTNSVQSNLYRGTDKSRDFCLANGWHLGVSIDFTKGIRTTAKGKDSDAGVIAAAESLHASGVRFGVVSVLGAHNRLVLPDAYGWIERFVDAWRILPLFEGAPDRVTEQLQITEIEIADIFLKLMDRRSRAARHVRIDPLDDYIRSAVLRITEEKSRRPIARELVDNVYVINVNGDVFTRPFAYDARYLIGNINDAGMFELLQRDGYRRCKDAILERKSKNCLSCRYGGYCDTSPVHEHGSIVADGGHERCAVPKLTIGAIENTLLTAGVDRSTIGAWAREWLQAA